MGEHVTTATDKSNLAGLLEDMERLEEAEPFYREALAVLKKLHGPDHPTVAVIVNNLGLLYSKLDRFAESEEFYRESLTTMLKRWGPDAPMTINCKLNLAALIAWNTWPECTRKLEDQLEEAVDLYTCCLNSFRTRFGDLDEDVLDCIDCLADLHKDLVGIYKDDKDRHEHHSHEAEKFYRESLVSRHKANGPDDEFIATNLDSLKEVLKGMGRHEEADAVLLEKVVEEEEKKKHKKGEEESGSQQ